MVLCLVLGALLGLGGVLYNMLIVGLLDLSERLRAIPVELRAAAVARSSVPSCGSTRSSWAAGTPSPSGSSTAA